MTKNIPIFTVRPEFLTSVTVEYGYTDCLGTFCTTQTQVDHPAFHALRMYLKETGFIQTWEGGWNGDYVLKEFKLNDHLFKKNDRFRCASALGISWKY